MDNDRQLIHEFLDGELSPEERETLLDRVNADPRLRKELDDLRSVVNMVETSERLSVPPSFTSEVMKRLLAHRESLRQRIRNFFFGERVLRWNVVTALATACLAIIIMGGIFQIQKKEHKLIPLPDSLKRSTSTVRMSFYAPRAKEVAIAGDFNKWSVEKGLMKKESNGIWTIEVPLQPGTYHYMFVVDGEAWVTDPNAELYRDDGFGNKNSVLRVSL